MEEIEALQWQGKAILALAWRIKPGQETLRVSRGEITGETGQEASQEIEIPLQPELSPAENAQRLFREYRKRKAAATRVPAEIEKTQREIAYLEQLLVDIDLAENRPELDQIQKTLQAAGYLPGQARPHQATSQPLQVTAQEEFLILVGRNSRQNEEITFHQSRPDDLWLHARGVPGGHVIIRCGGHPVSPETLRLAASLAAYYSAARHERQVAVDITERRYVRRLPEGGPGMVTYRQETTLLVTPEPPPATR